MLCLQLVSVPALSQVKPQAPPPGGAHVSVPFVRFSLASLLRAEPKDFDFSYGVERVVCITTCKVKLAWLMMKTRTVSHRP